MRTLTIFFLFIGIAAKAQLADVPTNPNSPVQTATADTAKFKTSWNVGTSYRFSPGLGSGNSLYVAPNFRWNLNSKFKINAGLVLARNQYSYRSQYSTLSNRSEIMLPSAGAGIDGAVYANTSYAVTNKLTITGSLFTDFASSPQTGMQSNGMSSNFNYMNVGLNYKLSDNVTIGASLNLAKYNPQSLYNMNYNNNYNLINNNQFGY
jgi:hypothetical protein